MTTQMEAAAHGLSDVAFSSTAPAVLKRPFHTSTIDKRIPSRVLARIWLP